MDHSACAGVAEAEEMLLLQISLFSICCMFVCFSAINQLVFRMFCIEWDFALHFCSLLTEMSMTRLFYYGMATKC